MSLKGKSRIGGIKRDRNVPPLIMMECPDGEIGRRTSFRCWRLQDRGSSSLLLGTTIKRWPVTQVTGLFLWFLFSFPLVFALRMLLHMPYSSSTQLDDTERSRAIQSARAGTPYPFGLAALSTALGNCTQARSLGGRNRRSEKRARRGQFLPDSPPHSRAMGPENG